MVYPRDPDGESHRNAGQRGRRHELPVELATTASYGYDAYGVSTSSTGPQAGTKPYRYASGMTDPTGRNCAESIAGLVLGAAGIVGSVVQFAVAALEGGAGFRIGIGLFELSIASLPLAIDSVTGSC